MEFSRPAMLAVTAFHLLAAPFSAYRHKRLVALKYGDDSKFAAKPDRISHVRTVADLAPLVVAGDEPAPAGYAAAVLVE